MLVKDHNATWDLELPDEYEEKVKDEDDGETLPLSPGLLFKCKSIYKEALLQFYAHMEFVFATARSALRFLDTVSPQAKAAIRHIELRHTTIGEIWSCMEKNEDREASDERWAMACKRMAQEFTSLHCLHIHEVIDMEDIYEPWAAPYLNFRQSQYAGNLRCAEVSVLKVESLALDPQPVMQYWMIDAAILEERSADLRNRLKGQKSVQEEKAEGKK